jgi:hypothetical protein
MIRIDDRANGSEEHQPGLMRIPCVVTQAQANRIARPKRLGAVHVNRIVASRGIAIDVGPGCLVDHGADIGTVVVQQERAAVAVYRDAAVQRDRGPLAAIWTTTQSVCPGRKVDNATFNPCSGNAGIQGRRVIRLSISFRSETLD